MAMVWLFAASSKHDVGFTLSKLQARMAHEKDMHVSYWNMIMQDLRRIITLSPYHNIVEIESGFPGAVTVTETCDHLGRVCMRALRNDR